MSIGTILHRSAGLIPTYASIAFASSLAIFVAIEANALGRWLEVHWLASAFLTVLAIVPILVVTLFSITAVRGVVLERYFLHLYMRQLERLLKEYEQDNEQGRSTSQRTEALMGIARMATMMGKFGISKRLKK